MKKSFQLSAIAIAIAASSSVMADQINVLSLDDIYGWIPTTSFDTDAFNTVTAAQSVTTPLVDLGSNIIGQYTPNSSNPTNMPVQQLQAGDGTYYYEIQDGLGNNATNNASLPSSYTVAGGVLSPYVNNTGSSTFIYGGTAADLTKGTFDITQSVKKLTEDNLTYSDAVTKYDSIQTDLAVTDAQGNATTFNDATVQSGDYTEQSDAVVTGTFDKNGSKVYGLNATSKQGSYRGNGELKSGWEKEALLTSDGLVSTAKNTAIDGTVTSHSTEVKAAGISTTGTLNVGGDTTLNKTTVNDLLTANNGAIVTGGLTADTATVNGTLTAGASTLDSLTVNNNATVTGMFNANGGATVTGGLTTDTATVTGALIAGASTLDSLNVTNDATVNGLFIVNNDANVIGKLTAGSVKTSVVDLGTISSTVTTNTAPSANRLTARYDTIDGNGSPITIYETQSGGVSTYYTINSGVATEYTDATVIGVLGKTVAPTAGGTTQTQSVLNTTTATVKEVTDKAVTYGEIKTQQDAVTVNGTLNNNENINVNVGTGAPVEVNNQSVVTGIIGTDSNSNNIYGTTAKSKVTAADGTVTADNTTTLTADGIVVADVVSGKSTIVNATGITTGTVTADTLIVGGTNVKDTLDQHTADIAKNTADITALDGRVTTEVNRLDGRVDAVDSRVTTEVGRLDGRVDTVDSRVTTEVDRLDGRINTVATDTLTSAKNYTDTSATALRGEAAAETTRVNKAIVDGDAATLASANTYTDATATTLRGEAAAETTRVNKAIADGNTATLASANSYTNTRVNQLNSRVDDVEKTAYRGIAIALAAQQAIPSIQPGQVAVFGGVGHYEGETAGAVGVVGALNDRTSLSAALGFAGGSEVGGRVGVAYVFGGK